MVCAFGVNLLAFWILGRVIGWGPPPAAACWPRRDEAPRRRLVVLALAGCGKPPSLNPGPSVRELAGPWRGRLALGGANARATLTIKEDGAYAGALHLESGDRPFTGAIVLARPGRLRYHGSIGDGSVVVTPPRATRDPAFRADGAEEEEPGA